MPEHTARWVTCLSCGTDERDRQAEIKASPGNAFVRVVFTNKSTGDRVCDDFLCAKCWCEFQQAFLERDQRPAGDLAELYWLRGYEAGVKQELENRKKESQQSA